MADVKIFTENIEPEALAQRKWIQDRDLFGEEYFACPYCGASTDKETPHCPYCGERVMERRAEK